MCPTKVYSWYKWFYTPVYIEKLDSAFLEIERLWEENKEMSKENIIDMLNIRLSHVLSDTEYNKVERPDDIETYTLSNDCILTYNMLEKIFHTSIQWVNRIAAIQQINEYSCWRACYNSLLMSLEDILDWYEEAKESIWYWELVVWGKWLIWWVKNMNKISQWLNNRLEKHISVFRTGITQQNLEDQCNKWLPTMVSYIATNKLWNHLPHYSLVIGWNDTNFFLYNPYDNKLQSIKKWEFMDRFNENKRYCTTFLLRVMKVLWRKPWSGIIIDKRVICWDWGIE